VEKRFVENELWELLVPESVYFPLLDVVEHLLRIVGGVVGEGLYQQVHQHPLLLLTQVLLPFFL
jgi:hypothetical protein